MKDYSDYHRITAYVPKEYKDTIAEKAKARGLSVSSYVCQLIEQDIGKMEGKAEYGTPGEGRRK